MDLSTISTILTMGSGWQIGKKIISGWVVGKEMESDWKSKEIILYILIAIINGRWKRHQLLLILKIIDSLTYLEEILKKLRNGGSRRRHWVLIAINNDKWKSHQLLLI